MKRLERECSHAVENVCGREAETRVEEWLLRRRRRRALLQQTVGLQMQFVVEVEDFLRTSFLRGDGIAISDRQIAGCLAEALRLLASNSPVRSSEHVPTAHELFGDCKSIGGVAFA